MLIHRSKTHAGIMENAWNGQRTGGEAQPQRRELNNPPIPLEIPRRSAKKAGPAGRHVRWRVEQNRHLITVPRVIICRKIWITAANFSNLSKSRRSRFLPVHMLPAAFNLPKTRERSDYVVPFFFFFFFLRSFRIHGSWLILENLYSVALCTRKYKWPI